MSMSSPETKMYNDDQFNTLDADLLDEIEHPELKKFLTELLELSIKEGKVAEIKGIRSIPMIRYGDEEINFVPKISTDADEMNPGTGHYEIQMSAWKKPWVHSLLSKTATNWLKFSDPTTASLYKELTGEEIYMADFEKSLGKSRVQAQNELRKRITENLGNIFSVAEDAGEYGLKVRFKSPELRDKYLNNDPALISELRTAFMKIFI